MVDGTRRALVIGVPTFGPEPELEDEPDLTAWTTLPFARRLALDVAQSLRLHGYKSTVVTDPGALAAEKLGKAVQGAIANGSKDDVCIVHLVSHGDVGAGSGGLFVVGSDGQICAETAVEHWLSDIEDFPETRPMTLFLLDLCHSGKAARLPWQLRGPRLTTWPSRVPLTWVCGPRNV
jgi:hypothetical protein